MLRVIAGVACFLVANQSLATAGLPALSPWRISSVTENAIAAVLFIIFGLYIAVRGTEDF